MINILPYRPDLAGAFETINTEWISSMFVLEQIDKDMLGDPQTYIVNEGGKIWFAEHQTQGIVGTCALLRHAPGVYELTKMGVLASARGLGIGETLLSHVVEQSRETGFDCLFLLTNKKCEAAIHLYLKYGFRHDQEIMATYGAEYTRCDVAMRYVGND